MVYVEAAPAVMWVRNLTGWGDVAHWLQRAARTTHNYGAVAHDPPEYRLIDINAFHFGSVHLDGMAPEDASLQNDAAVSDDKFRRKPPDRSRNPTCDRKRAEHGGGNKQRLL